MSRTPPLKLRGIDHIALGTDDMAASLRFYIEVMGFRQPTAKYFFQS